MRDLLCRSCGELVSVDERPEPFLPDTDYECLICISDRATGKPRSLLPLSDEPRFETRVRDEDIPY